MKSTRNGEKSLSSFSGASLHLECILPLSTLKKLARASGCSKKVELRLEVLDFAKKHSVATTCRRYGIARSTFYRWKKKFNPRNLKSLEDRSQRPRNTCKPRWTFELIETVRKLREQYPFLGKEKLVLFLQKEGFTVSSSTVGRIILYLKRRGVLREPLRGKRIKVTKKKAPRPYAQRKPKGYAVQSPGDLVEIDTLDIRPLPGKVYKQFTATCVLSRFSFAEVYSQATANLARRFLEKLLQESPFPIRAIQVDGGSEFYGEFEKACELYGLKLFVLPPYSPKLNGTVERLHRTFREEFWAYYEGEIDLKTMNAHLQYWTKEVYNKRRPHWALGYKSPWEYLREKGLLQVSHMC